MWQKVLIFDIVRSSGSSSPETDLLLSVGRRVGWGRASQAQQFISNKSMPIQGGATNGKYRIPSMQHGLTCSYMLLSFILPCMNLRQPFRCGRHEDSGSNGSPAIQPHHTSSRVPATLCRLASLGRTRCRGP